MSTDTHKGQHERCSDCNRYRWDKAQERKAAGEDPNRVVEREDEWDWTKGSNPDATEPDIKFAAKVLARCFTGSQHAFVEGTATPGSLSVTNFVIGLALGAVRPDLARRIRGGLTKGSAKATGMPAEHFEKQFKDMMDELQEIIRSEDAE